jgi:hypothetical protein
MLLGNPEGPAVKPFIITLLITWICIGPVHAADTNNFSQSVMEVLVTAQHFDALIPWKKDRPETRAGYAVVIEDGRLITTEDLVRNAVLIEIRRPGSATKTKATIVVADPRINAALLSAPTGGLHPVEWNGPVQTGSKIQLVQFDDAGVQQNGEGRITGIEVAALPSVAQSILTFQILTDLKLDRVGTPAFHEGHLAGLVMQYNRPPSSGALWRMPVIRRTAASPSPD